MKQEVEIEFKNLLTKSEYDRLNHSYPFPTQAVEQINHYFETPDFQLKKNGSALRIREKKDGFVLTLKEPHDEGLLETHDPLTKQEMESWLKNQPLAKENVYHQLETLGISFEDLKYYGSLKTFRKEVELDEILLVLDHSMYNNHEDYELELEASDKVSGERVFLEILEKHSIPVRKTPNKIERFFNSVKDI